MNNEYFFYIEVGLKWKTYEYKIIFQIKTYTNVQSYSLLC